MAPVRVWTCPHRAAGSCAPSGAGLCSSGCLSAASHLLLGTACEVGAGLPLLPKMIQRSRLAKGHTAQRGHRWASSHCVQGRGFRGGEGGRRSLRGLGASRLGEAREGTNFLLRWPVSSHCSHPGSQHCVVGACPPPAPPAPTAWSLSLGRRSQQRWRGLVSGLPGNRRRSSPRGVRRLLEAL